ncbi:MAG: hypothetical protein V7K33_33220 [Nostoc sp.]
MKNSLLTTPEVSPTAVVATDTFSKQTDTAVTMPSIVVAVARLIARLKLALTCNECF